MQIQISLVLDRARPEFLTTQIIAQIRDAIRFGRIAPGARLPSSRRLSEQLGVGRNTVVRAYDTLLMESYVESRPASGIFATVPEPDPRERAAPQHAAPADRKPAHPAPGLPAAIAPAGPAPARSRLSFDFAPSQPDPALFPLKAWRRLLRGCLSQAGAGGLAQPVDPIGLAALRAAIANHLPSARGIVAGPGQIVITSGITEGLSLAARLLLKPGAVAAVEMPGSQTAASIFTASGAELAGIRVDEDGLVADDLPLRPATLLHLTPAHQFPTGHVLSRPRAERIVAWARRTGCMIVEDDRGADFRYAGAPAPALAAMAPECTFHLGSFSQALGAGLRLGYMVVPPHFADAVRTAKALSTGGTPWLDQAALSEFLHSGSFVSHVLRMRAAYRERRDHLLAALSRQFGTVEVSGEAGGMHLFWQLPPGVPDAPTVEALGRRARVGVYSLETAGVHDPFAGPLSRRAMLVGYASLTPKQIEQGIARLSDAVDDALDGHRIGFSDLLSYRPVVARAPASHPRRPGAKPALSFRQKPALSAPAPRRAGSRPRTDDKGGDRMPVITGLYRYPIKGLSPQPIETIRIVAGQPFPFDRVFALARPGKMNTAEPTWAKKGLFVMLMLDEGLARVRTELDEATSLLTVWDGPCVMLEAYLTEGPDRARVEAFFHRLVPSLAAAPSLVRAREGHFMDKPDNVVSLINLATLRRLEEQWGFPIDPLRFRANIYIDGAAPWEEFDWVGQDVMLSGTLFHVDRRNGRCGATNVDPRTGQRDLDIPGSLRRAFGHKDLGVYLVARGGGELAVGAALERPGLAGRRPEPARDGSAPASSATFICRGCYYIYDEAQGAPATGAAPGTHFTDLPNSWRCPDCGTDKETFRPTGGS
jgi:GntR family transcriptional regulator/MocR family aminotransferase